MSQGLILMAAIVFISINFMPFFAIGYTSYQWSAKNLPFKDALWKGVRFFICSLVAIPVITISLLYTGHLFR